MTAASSRSPGAGRYDKDIAESHQGTALMAYFLAYFASSSERPS
jgi:hypothetical protein